MFSDLEVFVLSPDAFGLAASKAAEAQLAIRQLSILSTDPNEPMTT